MGILARDVLTNIVFVLASVFLQSHRGLFLALSVCKEILGTETLDRADNGPMAMTPSVSATIWKYLLDFNIGPVNYFLKGFLTATAWFSSYPLALFLL
jgi:ABC-type sugar transport system permease subunit